MSIPEATAAEDTAAQGRTGGDQQTKVDMSIILVCWNNKDYLDPCLKSIYDGNMTFSYDIIVVDNGSTDGSMDMVREKYPEVIIIENGKNLGLSGATNQGIRATQGKYVLLLNNDTLVSDKALNAMAKFLDENPGAGAAGGKLLNGDGSFQSGYAMFTNLWEEFMNITLLGYLLFPGYPSHRDSDKVKKVGWLSSACLLIRRSTLDKVGLLDESYFIYGDEADLQYRMSKAGQPVYYIPGIATTHFGGKSMRRWSRRKMVYRGKLLFFQKNYGWLPTIILRIMLAVLTFFKIIVSGILYPFFPKHRKNIKEGLQSNIDVIKLCFNLK